MGKVWAVNAIVANAKDLGEFPVLSDGLYKFVISEKEDGETNEAKLPKVTLKLDVVEGPEAGSMRHTVVLFPETDEKTGNPNRMYGALLHFLHAIGVWDGKEDAAIEFDTEEFLGREFWANVTTREYPKKDKAGNETGETGHSNKITSIPIPEEGQEAPAGPVPAEEPAGEPAPTTEEQAAAEAQAAEEAAAAEAEAAEAAAKKAATPKPKPGVKAAPAKVGTNGHAKVVAKAPVKVAAKAPVKTLVKKKF